MSKETKQVGLLSFKEKLSYGFGDLASVLYWQTFMLYFTYFYTDVFLIPAAAAATLFLVSRIFDGVNDTIMGMIADRTNTKWGKFRPYILWFCLPFAVVGVLVFTVPDFDITGKIIWAYITFNLIMLLYTIINIPYTALLGVISPSSVERTTVSSIKFLFAFAAGIIISATLLPMTQKLGSGDNSIVKTEISNNTIVIKEGKRGVSNILITGTDEKGNSSTKKIHITVASKETNKPVVVNPIADINATASYTVDTIFLKNVFQGRIHSNFEYTIKNSNPNIVTIWESLEDKNPFICIEKSQKAVEGYAEISLIAKDKKWGDVSESFNINVTDGNSIPQTFIDTTSNVTLNTGFVTKIIEISSLIKNPQQYEISVKSSNEEVLKTNIKKGTIEIIEGQPGIAQLTITAKNGNKLYSEKTYCYTIQSKENNKPFVLSKINNLNLVEGFKTKTILVKDLFTDIENEKVTCTIESVNEAKGWQRFFMIIGALAVVFFFITFKGTRERVKPPVAQKTTIKNDLKELFTNKPWLILLAGTITFILFVAVRGSVTVHYFKYIIGTQTLSLPFFGEQTYDFTILASAYNTIGQISSLLGVIAISFLAKKFGKKRMFFIFFVLAILSTAIVYVLTVNQLGLIFVAQIVGSFTGGPLSVLLWAMYADTADYGEWKNGRRATGLIFSASTMSQKFGWAFGAYIALTLMAQVGFIPDEVQSADSIHGLIALFTIIPAAIGIISTIILLVYPLNDKRVNEIELELLERRRLAGEAIID